MESNLEFGLISRSYLCGIICTYYIWMDRNSDHNVRFHRDTAATLFVNFFHISLLIIIISLTKQSKYILNELLTLAVIGWRDCFKKSPSNVTQKGASTSP